jgi:hypothetical protein
LEDTARDGQGNGVGTFRLATQTRQGETTVVDGGEEILGETCATPNMTAAKSNGRDHLVETYRAFDDILPTSPPRERRLLSLVHGLHSRLIQFVASA